MDLPIPQGLQPALRHPFKGKMDLATLRRLLDEQASAVPLVVLTVTNNFSGGQPVSLANIQAVREVWDRSRSSSEPLVLQHENAVLRRQISQVRYQPADRLWLFGPVPADPPVPVRRGVPGDLGDTVRPDRAQEHCRRADQRISQTSPSEPKAAGLQRERVLAQHRPFGPR